jgi:hypothetical protein|tara:strand:+ start:330 stop:452 length:123 start_codon:yes stop_codon:yes gene_type:complete
MKKIKPYFTAANKSMGGKPEKFGLPSNKQIQKSVYLKVKK